MMSIIKQLSKKQRTLCLLALILLAPILLIAIFLAFGYLLLFLYSGGQSMEFVTHDLADYRIITGTCNDSRVQARMDSFFPEQIEEYFTEIQYSYCANIYDNIGCEAYLEFVIEDDVQFQEYVQNTLEQLAEQEEYETAPFRYDNAYQEYVLWDRIHFHSPYTVDENETYYYIESACILKILINESENRVIYEMLIVYNGGGSSTEQLGRYFERFHIDPMEYKQYTDSIIEKAPAWLNNIAY